MDYSVFKDINGLAGNSVVDRLMELAANDLIYVLVAFVAALFLAPWSRRRAERRIAAVTATLSAGVALLIGQVISGAVDRARPFVGHHVHLLIAHARDASLPSDHTTAAFALAVAVLVYDRIAGTLLVAAGVLIAFARVFVGVHYPGDVLAGAALGAAVALVLARTPLARAVRAGAMACSALWERVLAVVVGTRFAPVDQR